MSLTQAVSYIDREQLGLSHISCPLLLRFRGPRHNISLYIVDHYLNIVLPESSSIVCQIHIENRESECLVWLNLRKWMARASVEIS